MSTSTITVFFRKRDRRWVVKFPDGKLSAQKYCPRHVTTEREALRWGRTWYAEQVAAGEIGKPRATGVEMSIGDAYKEWLKKKKLHVKSRTAKNYETHFNTHILPAFRDRRLSTVKANEIASFLDGLPVKANNTKRNVFFSFKTFAAEVQPRNYDLVPALREDPFASVIVSQSLPPAKTVAGKVIYISLDSARTLLSCESVEWAHRVLYALAFLTGMDVEEISGLQWRDVHLDDAIPYLEVLRGFKVDGNLEDDLKTAQRRRLLPLHVLAVIALRMWRVYWRLLVRRAPEPGDPVFANEDGHHHRPAFAKWLRADLAKAKLPTKVDGQPITFHAVRRSFGTWLLDVEPRPELRKRLMGHSDSDVTSEHYTAKELSTLQSVVQRIDLVGNLVGVPTWMDEIVRRKAEARTGFEPAFDGFASSDDAGAIGGCFESEGLTDPLLTVNDNGQVVDNGPSEGGSTSPHQGPHQEGGVRDIASARLRAGLLLRAAVEPAMRGDQGATIHYLKQAADELQGVDR